jgi:hypothetical protein
MIFPTVLWLPMDPQDRGVHCPPFNDSHMPARTEPHRMDKGTLFLALWLPPVASESGSVFRLPALHLFPRMQLRPPVVRVWPMSA